MPAVLSPSAPAIDLASERVPQNRDRTKMNPTRTETLGILGYVAETVAAAIHELGAKVRRMAARHRKARQARLAYEVLCRLDDRTLRDIGLHRSELQSKKIM